MILKLHLHALNCRCRFSYLTLDNLNKQLLRFLEHVQFVDHDAIYDAKINKKKKKIFLISSLTVITINATLTSSCVHIVVVISKDFHIVPCCDDMHAHEQHVLHMENKHYEPMARWSRDHFHLNINHSFDDERGQV